MWSRRLIIVAISLAAGIFDASIVSWFSGGWGAFRMSLPLVVLLAAFSSRERAVTAAVSAGLVLDLFQPSFGLVAIRYALVALGMHAVAERYVTNRTLLGSLALGLAGVMTDRVALFLITALRGLSQRPFIPETHPLFWMEAGWTACVVGAAFLAFAAFGKRFLPLVTRR